MKVVDLDMLCSTLGQPPCTYWLDIKQRDPPLSYPFLEVGQAP